MAKYLGQKKGVTQFKKKVLKGQMMIDNSIPSLLKDIWVKKFGHSWYGTNLSKGLLANG